MDDGTAVPRIIRVKDSLASCSAKGGWRVGRGGVSGEGVSGQHIYVGGATGGDAEVEWGGGEAYMGRGMPISGCDGLQRGPRREPDAIV